MTTHPREGGRGRGCRRRWREGGLDRGGQLQYLRKPRGIPPRYRVHRHTGHGNRGVGPRAGRATVARSSSLTTEIYNEFPVQPGRKFARARPLVPTTLHKRYRGRIAHSDLKQPFRQCGDASVRRRGCTRDVFRAEKYISSRMPVHPEPFFFFSLLFILSLVSLSRIQYSYLLSIGFSFPSDVKLHRKGNFVRRRISFN